MTSIVVYSEIGAESGKDRQRWWTCMVETGQNCRKTWCRTLKTERQIVGFSKKTFYANWFSRWGHPRAHAKELQRELVFMHTEWLQCMNWRFPINTNAYCTAVGLKHLLPSEYSSCHIVNRRGMVSLIQLCKLSKYADVGSWKPHKIHKSPLVRNSTATPNWPHLFFTILWPVQCIWRFSPSLKLTSYFKQDGVTWHTSNATMPDIWAFFGDWIIFKGFWRH